MKYRLFIGVAALFAVATSAACSDTRPSARTKSLVVDERLPEVALLPKACVIWVGMWLSADPATALFQEIVADIASEFCGRASTDILRV